MTVIIGDQGLVETTGGNDFNVQGAVHASAFSGSIRATHTQMLPSTIGLAQSSGTILITKPGFYYVEASGTIAAGGTFTGSLPPAQYFPGGMIWISDSRADFDFAVKAPGQKIVEAPSGTPAQGETCNVSKGGSVVMTSDGYYWLLCAGIGTRTFSG
jgi:hypothetical protein